MGQSQLCDTRDQLGQLNGWDGFVRNLQGVWRFSGDLRVKEKGGFQIWAAEPKDSFFWEVVEGKKNEMSHVFLCFQHLFFLLNLRPRAWWGRTLRVSSLQMCLA